MPTVSMLAEEISTRWTGVACRVKGARSATGDAGRLARHGKPFPARPESRIGVELPGDGVRPVSPGVGAET